MILLRMKLRTSSVRSRIAKLGVLATAFAMLVAAAVTARVPALVQDLKREVDREASNRSDVVIIGQKSAAQIFVERYGLKGRKAAEYVAWRYRASRPEPSYCLAAIDVLRLLRSDQSRGLLQRLSEDESTTSSVRLSAAAALSDIPDVDQVTVISRILEKGPSADRRGVLRFILRYPDARLLSATERALQAETDDEARGALMLARDLLKNPGKCVLYADFRQGDGSLTCVYYCPHEIYSVSVDGWNTCEPVVDPETARSGSRK